MLYSQAWKSLLRIRRDKLKLIPLARPLSGRNHDLRACRTPGQPRARPRPCPSVAARMPEIHRRLLAPPGPAQGLIAMASLAARRSNPHRTARHEPAALGPQLRGRDARRGSVQWLVQFQNRYLLDLNSP